MKMAEISGTGNLKFHISRYRKCERYKLDLNRKDAQHDTVLKQYNSPTYKKRILKTTGEKCHVKKKPLLD